MHHGSDLPDRMAQESLRKQFGPTNRFPEGKLNDTDEGEIQFGVSHDPASRKVVLNFGKPVAWIGMNAAQAMELSACLRKHAIESSLIGKRAKSDANGESHGQGTPTS